MLKMHLSNEILEDLMSNTVFSELKRDNEVSLGEIIAFEKRRYQKTQEILKPLAILGKQYKIIESPCSRERQFKQVGEKKISHYPPSILIVEYQGDLEKYFHEDIDMETIQVSYSLTVDSYEAEKDFKEKLEDLKEKLLQERVLLDQIKNRMLDEYYDNRNYRSIDKNGRFITSVNPGEISTKSTYDSINFYSNYSFDKNQNKSEIEIQDFYFNTNLPFIKGTLNQGKFRDEKINLHEGIRFSVENIPENVAEAIIRTRTK